MRKASRAFLGKLLSAPGPSGYEGPVRKVWRAEVEKHADSVTVDVHGNAIAVVNAGGQPRVMLAGHMDELGFQVVHINDDGFISFDTVGGFDIGIQKAGELIGEALSKAFPEAGKSPARPRPAAAGTGKTS